MKCVHGKQIFSEKNWYCYYCGDLIPSKPINIVGYKGDSKVRRPLSEYEAMKLGWYRDEKKWIENIQSRKIIEKNGVKTTVLLDNKGNIRREMPSK